MDHTLNFSKPVRNRKFLTYCQVIEEKLNQLDFRELREYVASTGTKYIEVLGGYWFLIGLIQGLFLSNIDMNFSKIII